MGLVKKGAKKKLKKKASSGGGMRDGSDLRPTYVPKTPPCINGCPNHNDIRGMLTYVAQSETYERSYEDSFKTAFGMLAETNPFPGICGRVCPHPCEDNCNRKDVDQRVSINAFERTMGDFALEHKLALAKVPGEEEKGKKVAIIGSGPAGMSCAYQMIRRGYLVTVFEAFPKVGGMLRYGIPYYRLPAEIIDAEYQRVFDMGVELKLNTIVGKDITFDQIKNDFDAAFVGIGAHVGKGLRVDGEDAPNVMSGADFLNKINSHETIDVGNSVLVVGGGNTAIDAARVSRRLGADVTLVYRRTENEMPAIEEEIKDAKDEGVKFELLAAPVSFEKDGDLATAMTCIRMELGEPDESGRRRPVPIEGSEFKVECSFVIPAISQEPDFEGMEEIREGRDWIKIDEFGRTKLERIFAGGDAINLYLVTGALAHGRFAAEAMHATLSGEEPKAEEFPLEVNTTHKFDSEGRGFQMFLAHYEKMERNDVSYLPVDERFGDNALEKEVSKSFSFDQAVAESKRCLSCGACFKCGNCYNYCQDNSVVKPMDINEPYYFKLELCQGCKKCAENCPCGYIDMH